MLKIFKILFIILFVFSMLSCYTYSSTGESCPACYGSGRNNGSEKCTYCGGTGRLVTDIWPLK